MGGANRRSEYNYIVKSFLPSVLGGFNLKERVRLMVAKTISIKIEEELLQEFKIKVAQSGKSLQDYMCELINSDINPATPQQKLQILASAEQSLNKALTNLEMYEKEIMRDAGAVSEKNESALSENERILKACEKYPAFKRVALYMIDYVEEQLKNAMENHNDGIYIINQKDLPVIDGDNHFDYQLFLEMLMESEMVKEADDINTGDVEIELNMEYISKMNGESVEQAPSLSF